MYTITKDTIVKIKNYYVMALLINYSLITNTKLSIFFKKNKYKQGPSNQNIQKPIFSNFFGYISPTVKN